MARGPKSTICLPGDDVCRLDDVSNVTAAIVLAILGRTLNVTAFDPISIAIK
jgi:hypothetical protein